MLLLLSSVIDLLNCSKRSALPCDVVRVVSLVCSETPKKRLDASQSISKKLAYIIMKTLILKCLLDVSPSNAHTKHQGIYLEPRGVTGFILRPNLLQEVRSIS